MTDLYISLFCLKSDNNTLTGITIRRSQEIVYPRVLLNGIELGIKSSTNYLGVTIDCDLTWKEHIKKITGTAYGALKSLSLVKRSKRSLPTNSRKLLYTETSFVKHTYIAIRRIDNASCP